MNVRTESRSAWNLVLSGLFISKAVRCSIVPINQTRLEKAVVPSCRGITLCKIRPVYSSLYLSILQATFTFLLLFEGENRNGSCEKYHDSKWFTKSNTKGKEDTTYFNRSCDISERLAEILVRIFRVVERQLREEDNRHCYGNEPGVEPH